LKEVKKQQFAKAKREAKREAEKKLPPDILIITSDDDIDPFKKQREAYEEIQHIKKSMTEDTEELLNIDFSTINPIGFVANLSAEITKQLKEGNRADKIKNTVISNIINDIEERVVRKIEAGIKNSVDIDKVISAVLSNIK